jgi:transposase
MRYPQGGGLTAERRAFREQIRVEAAARFAAGQDSAVIARELRVHIRSVQRWRRAWNDEGVRGLRSKGPASHPMLSEELFAALEAELERGPAAHGWPDQKWTIGRIATVIGRRFHKSYTEQGVRLLLIRHGWSGQVPARRALERDEQAVAAWVKETWQQAEEPRRRSGPGSSSRTRPGSR